MKVIEVLFRLKSDADKVAENHRVNYADEVSVTFDKASGEYLMRAVYKS